VKRMSLSGLAVLLLLVGCGPTPVPTLPPDQAQNFAAQMQATSDNVLMALNNHDYASFTKDMDAAMKQASTGAEFEKIYQFVVGKIGKYVSGQMVRVEEGEQGGLRLRSIIYDARFEQEDHVTVRVVYNMATDPPLVSGLWFDSPKLRQ
jgi:hypothetical protein